MDLPWVGILTVNLVSSEETVSIDPVRAEGREERAWVQLPPCHLPTVRSQASHLPFATSNFLI